MSLQEKNIYVKILNIVLAVEASKQFIRRILHSNNSEVYFRNAKLLTFENH